MYHAGIHSLCLHKPLMAPISKLTECTNKTYLESFLHLILVAQLVSLLVVAAVVAVVVVAAAAVIVVDDETNTFISTWTQ